jgi:hypothetical protein
MRTEVIAWGGGVSMSKRDATTRIDDKREQINLRVDREFLDAISEIRRAHDDPPSKSEAIRAAVFEVRDRLRRSGKVRVIA